MKNKFSTWHLVLFGLIGSFTGNSYSEPIYTAYNINIIEARVFNDRIGDSRFFVGANTDRLRVSTSISPSRDSDVIGIPIGEDDYFSTNGSETKVILTHQDSPALERELAFVGLCCGGGGSRNEFTTTFDLANPIVASQLALWDATPFTITVQNSMVPDGGATSVTYATPDYDKDIFLPFLTDISVTGGGLNPTLNWVVPDTEAAITNVTIQIRRIESEEPGRITSATLVHSQQLPLGETSYAFDTQFSNSYLPNVSEGLEMGRKYEIAIALESRTDGQLKARTRKFFEFTPLMDVEGNVAIFLPSVGTDGVFRFDVKVVAGETIYIDPVVAIGYDYQIGEGDPTFASVTLPSVGDGLYELWLYDLALDEYIFETDLDAGFEYFFADGGVDRFRVLGIETSAGLDPLDVTAFVTALTFTGDGRFTGTMTPITFEITSVPEPPVIALIAMALLGLGLRRSAPRQTPPGFSTLSR